MLIDILSDPKTAKLFYVNDIEVLVDIIIRQLLNIPSDEMVIIYYNYQIIQLFYYSLIIHWYLLEIMEKRIGSDDFPTYRSI